MTSTKKTSTMKMTTTDTEKKTHFQVASIAPCTTNDAYQMKSNGKGAELFAFKKPKEAIAAFRSGLENVSDFENWEQEPDATTLNIVLAPEWYFQKKQKKPAAASGEDNGSSLDLAELGLWTRQEMLEICKGIQKASRDYPGWLLIPGTILWANPIEVNGVAIAEVFNTSQIVAEGKVVHTYHKQSYGGDMSTHVVCKDQLFGFDPNITQKLSEEQKEAWKSWAKHLAGKPKSKKGVKAVVQNSFEYSGLKFGIEVCADHLSCGPLRKERDLQSLTPEQLFDRDIHILLSCGAWMKESHVVLKKGGWFLHAEGLTFNKKSMQQGKALNISRCEKIGAESLDGTIGQCTMKPSGKDWKQLWKSKNGKKEDGTKGKKGKKDTTFLKLQYSGVGTSSFVVACGKKLVLPK